MRSPLSAVLVASVVTVVAAPRAFGDSAGLAAEINQIASGAPTGFATFNGKLVYAANNGINGAELWSFDGVNAAMVSDIYSGATASSPANFKVFNNAVYFSAKTSSNGIELWKWDGVNKPSLVYDIYSGTGSSKMVKARTEIAATTRRTRTAMDQPVHRPRRPVGS